MSDAISNFNVSDMFEKFTKNIQNRSEDLSTKMDDLTKLDGDINPESMIALQFEIGQYNAMLEAVSTVTKALTDEAKQLAQRAN